jgi:hypothetical protein
MPETFSLALKACVFKACVFKAYIFKVSQFLAAAPHHHLCHLHTISRPTRPASAI